MAKNRNAPDDLQALRSHLADVEKRLAESIRKEMAPRREVAYDQMAVRSARAKLAAALALKRRELLSKRRDLNKLIGDLQTKEEDLLCPRPGGDMAATRPERQLALAALRPVLRRLLDLGPEELGPSARPRCWNCAGSLTSTPPRRSRRRRGRCRSPTTTLLLEARHESQRTGPALSLRALG